MKYFLSILLSFLLLFPGFAFSQGSFRSDSSKVQEYLNAAIVFERSGQYQKAKEVLNEALEKIDDDKIRFYLGKLEFVSTRLKKSLKHFQELKKDDWLKFLYLGLVYERMGKYNKAVSNYRKSSEKHENIIALFRIAKIYRSQGQPEKGVDFFKKVIKADPSIRLAYLYAGELCYDIGEYENAYNYLAKAIAFYPDREGTRKKLELVKAQLGQDYFAAKVKKQEEAREKVKLPPYLPVEGVDLIKVGLAVDLDRFVFSSSGDFNIKTAEKSFSAQADKFYRITIKNGKLLLLEVKNDAVLEEFTAPIRITSQLEGVHKYPFYVLNMKYGKGDFWQKSIDRAYRGDLEIIVRNEKITLINVINIEEYLYGVLSAEIQADSPADALAAQAVAARTIAIRNKGRHKAQGFNFCDDVHCQAYKGLFAETSPTTKAVDTTRGEIIVYESKPIESFYHSNSGGCLAADVFGEPKFLIEKADAKEAKIPQNLYEEEMWFLNEPESFSGDVKSDKFRWQRIYDSEDYENIYGVNIAILINIFTKEQGDCFHNKKIEVVKLKGNETIEGDLAIRNYFDKLKSSAFKLDIAFNREGGALLLIFWGAGFGHGSGMSQDGAKTMAKEGYNYKEILKHYYYNVEIEKAY